MHRIAKQFFAVNFKATPNINLPVNFDHKAQLFVLNFGAIFVLNISYRLHHIKTLGPKLISTLFHLVNLSRTIDQVQHTQTGLVDHSGQFDLIRGQVIRIL